MLKKLLFSSILLLTAFTLVAANHSDSLAYDKPIGPLSPGAEASTTDLA